MIGTGVFALPSALAGYGPISLVAFVLVTIGSIALALTFGSLSGRTPASGGPYLYARQAFGEFAGFLNAWSYWITAWAGNAAIVVAWVGYVEVFWNTDHAKAWSIVIALVGLWLPAVVNLAGLRSIAWFQMLTTVIKFVPLLFIATVGLLFIKSANFGAFNASGGSSLSAISAAAAIALFSYLGIETASVAAGRVRDPARNVGRATVLGTLGCAFVYLLGTVAVFGTVAHHKLLDSTAPFTDSADAIFGGQWAGKTVAVAAIVSGIGALVGWTLIVAEMPQAAARDRLFPARFARESRAGVPAFGIVTSTLLASALTVVSYTRFDKVFTTIVLLSVLTSVIPYLFSAAAQLSWLVTRRAELAAGRFARRPGDLGHRAHVHVLDTRRQRLPGRLLRSVLRLPRRPGVRVDGRVPHGQCRINRVCPGNGGAPMTVVDRPTDATLQVGVESEVGQLREVIVHRPGTELERRSPANAADLLFDDVLWPDRARNEHDAFAEALRTHGARVHVFFDLLAEALATPSGRAFAIDHICTADRFGPTLAHDLRQLFADTDPATLADYLIGGVVKSDLSPPSSPSLAWQVFDIEDFVLVLTGALDEDDGVVRRDDGLGV